MEVSEFFVKGNLVHVARSTAGAIARGAYTWLRESGSGMEVTAALPGYTVVEWKRIG
jgi:hypothetical protein